MILIKNIGAIVGVRDHADRPLRGEEMNRLPELRNAWLLTDGDRIHSYGKMPDCPQQADETVDARGGWLFPAFCDSHTHLIFAGNREKEFVDKINGLSYAEIAARGGGILNSADRLHGYTEQQLFEEAAPRLDAIMRSGTGAVEIKSGYGLTLEDELKMLRVIARIKEE